MDKKNIYGEYKIYKNNELISSVKNSLTKAGRIAALRCLTGDQTTFARYMGVGIGTSTNSFDANTNLITNLYPDYEIKKIEILPAWKIDTTDNYSKIVFSGLLDNVGTIPSNRYIISELGLSANSPASPPLNIELSIFGSMTFSSEKINVKYKVSSDSDSTPKDIDRTTSSAKYVDIFANTNASANFIRYGNEGIHLSKTCSIVSTPTTAISLLDSGNPSNSLDKFIIALHKSNNTSHDIHLKIWCAAGYTSTQAASLKYIATTTATSSVVLSFTASAPNDSYNINNDISNFKWNAINKIEIASSSANSNGSQIILDSLKYLSTGGAIDGQFGFLSRAVLANPIVKNDTDTFRIEYYLNFGFNQGL